MKKILSFVLVLAMIASMMCVNASAALIVGSGEGNNKIGVDAGWTTGTNQSDIVASVEGSRESKYAVDLEYTQKNIFIQSDLTWDVNTLHYEGTAYIAIGSKPDITVNMEGWTALVNGQNGVVENIGEFAITNYSDKPVYVTAEISSTPDGDEAITTVLHETMQNLDDTTPVEIANPVTVSSTVASEIIGVDDYTVSSGGTANIKYYAADMTCDDWAQALYNMSQTGATQFTIASITFVISSTNP